MYPIDLGFKNGKDALLKLTHLLSRLELELRGALDALLAINALNGIQLKSLEGESAAG